MWRLLGLAVYLITFACSPSTYIVTIKSDPLYAEVTELGYKKIGYTNCSQKVNKGDSLFYTFTKKGFMNETYEIKNIRADETILVRLKPVKTSVIFESNPKGALVELMFPVGISIGTFNSGQKYFLENQSGPMQARISYVGYKTTTKDVKIEPGSENRFSFQMERLFLRVNVISHPSGVSVYERDLGFLGRTPLELDLIWDQLQRLSSISDPNKATWVKLLLTFKKEGLKDVETVKMFSLYESNPDLVIEMGQ